jgi:hypothetical protein
MGLPAFRVPFFGLARSLLHEFDQFVTRHAIETRYGPIRVNQCASRILRHPLALTSG